MFFANQVTYDSLKQPFLLAVFYIDGADAEKRKGEAEALKAALNRHNIRFAVKDSGRTLVVSVEESDLPKVREAGIRPTTAIGAACAQTGGHAICQLGDEFFELAAAFSELDSAAAQKIIRERERDIDALLAKNEISQEKAWDMYFCLLHECDERRLWSDRERIVGKIDRKRYNPFLSETPGVVLIARIRLDAANKKSN